MQALALYDGVIVFGILAIVVLTLEWIDPVAGKPATGFSNPGVSYVVFLVLLLPDTDMVVSV